MDARTKGIEIGELNSCNAQPLEKSESIEAGNRQPDQFQESSMAPALSTGTTVNIFLRRNNEGAPAQSNESDASNLVAHHLSKDD